MVYKSSYILVPACLIFVIGIVMIFNTTSADAIDHSLIEEYYGPFLRQIGYACLAFLLSLLVYKVGYKKWIDYAPYLLFFFSLCLLAVFIPGIGISVNGAKRWISLFGFSIQPSEFVKYTILVYFIYSLRAYGGKISTFKEFIGALKFLSIPFLLILLEPNNGTVAVMGMALIALFFITRVPLSFWAMPMCVCIFMGTLFAWNLPYVRARIEVYRHPEKDLLGKGHQPFQAKIAAGSGGLLGRGPGASIQKFSYLPESQNDYIAAIYAEEYGFLGILVLIALYSIIAILGFKVAFLARDIEGVYIAASFSFLLSLQAFLNLAVVSGLLPSTGLNLPFLSQGGSSLWANAMALAMIMSVQTKRAI